MGRCVAVGSTALLAASVLVALDVPAEAAHTSAEPVVTAVASNYGATVGYTHVIISGRRFTGTPQVTFGSISASTVHVVSSHTLVVYAPGHRHGTVHVRVRTAAGTSPRSDENLYTYVHQVTPGSWQAQTAPVPPGEPADDYVGAATSCPTTTACYSVGTYGPADEDAARSGPLISTRVAGRFTTQRAPLPAGVDRERASLYLIDCPAAGHCVAAGSYDNGRHGLVLVLASGTWTASTVDLHEGTHRAEIDGLSCGAPGECVAIGYRPTVSVDSHDPVVLRLHNGTWTTTDVVPPAKGGTELDNVDCASASYCLASGFYGRGTQAAGAFIVQVADGKQTVRAIPDAPHEGQPTGTGAVQCPAVGRCTVLTAFADSDLAGGKDASDFVTVENGRSFAFRPITLPADADSLSLFAYGSGTGSMSCPEVSVCYAASAYETKGFYIASVARLDHGEVNFYNLPRPGSPREDVGVSDIDCVTSTACTAVGTAYLVGKVDPVETVGAYFTFANGVWTPEIAPAAPGQHSAPTGTFYTSVECPAAGACTADGNYAWDPEPYSDDGNVYYLYDKDSGLVSLETPN